MKLVTSLQMKRIEEEAMNDRGVPSLLLMENAARGAVDEIIKLNPKRVCIFAGKGNNGGDGIAIARGLMTNGIYSRVYFAGEPEKATLDCNTNYSVFKAYDGEIVRYKDKNIDISDCDVIVDALIGTGLKKKLSDKYEEIVNIINSAPGKVVAIDCPTGVNSDFGWDYDSGVYADMTICFHYAKTGLMLYPAYKHIGKLVVKNIGIPYKPDGITTFTLEKDEASKLMPKRFSSSHKGSYGKACFISGCDTMAGAAVLNASAAYHTGSGLVNVCTTSKAIDVIHTLVPEAVTTFREDYRSLFGNSVIALGSGLGRDFDNVVYDTVKNHEGTLIIDADGLNAIASNKKIIDEHKGECIITPHIKEMSRLVGSDTKTVGENMIGIATDYAKAHNVTVVLKSANSVIASPDGRVCINISGNSGLSKGGSGDCLTGIITGLCAQGLNCFDAACLGTYIFGKTGEIMSQKYTEYSVQAFELTKNIHLAIKELLN